MRNKKFKTGESLTRIQLVKEYFAPSQKPEPPTKEESERMARRAGLALVLTGIIALGVTKPHDIIRIDRAIGAFIGQITYSSPEDHTYEHRIERCVGKLTQRDDINLVPDSIGGLQHPASVAAEQKACEETSGVVILARQHLAASTGIAGGQH